MKMTDICNFVNVSVSDNSSVFDDSLVGPLSLTSNLNGDVHSQLLEETVDPILTNIIENNDRYCNMSTRYTTFCLACLGVYGCYISR